jgi:hypothetical protein
MICKTCNGKGTVFLPPLLTLRDGGGDLDDQPAVGIEIPCPSCGDKQ